MPPDATDDERKLAAVGVQFENGDVSRENVAWLLNHCADQGERLREAYECLIEAGFACLTADEIAEMTCRACENRLCDVQPVPSGKRLCLTCGPQPTARFAKDERGRWTECCVGCTGEPEVRVLVRHEVVAARVLKGLRQIAAGRLDCSSGFPTLGADGLRQIAAELLAAVEAAR